MDLAVDGPPIAPEFEDAMGRGLAKMGIDDVEVLYTDDFVGTVADLTGDPSYNAARGQSGTVAAKTLLLPTGQVAIVANRVCLEEFGVEATERTFAHEGGHVHVLNRDENVEPAHINTGLPEGIERHLATASAFAIDEYRCEAAAMQAGYPAEFAQTNDGVADAMYEFCATGLQPFYEQPSSDEVKTHFWALVDRGTKFLAYLAARHLHAEPFDPGKLPSYARGSWEDLFADAWSEAVGLYTALPTSSEPVDRKDILDAAVAGVNIVETFSRSFGAVREGDGFSWLIDEGRLAERADRFRAHDDAL